jgi:hypothetical protein
MWEPRRLITVWASTACYKDSFTFLFIMDELESGLALKGMFWGRLERVKLEYLDVTVLRRGVGEVRLVAGRAPAC